MTKPLAAMTALLAVSLSASTRSEAHPGFIVSALIVGGGIVLSARQAKKHAKREKAHQRAQMNAASKLRMTDRMDAASLP